MGKDGFPLSMDELKQTLNDMDVVQSVDDEVITPKGKIPNDMAEPDAEAELK